MIGLLNISANACPIAVGIPRLAFNLLLEKNEYSLKIDKHFELK